MDCGNSSTSVTFKTSQGFQAAQKAWNWVNQGNGRYISMVSDLKSCNNGQRTAFHVTGTKGDAKQKQIKFTGKEIKLKDAFPVWNFKLNTKGVNDGKQKRCFLGIGDDW